MSDMNLNDFAVSNGFKNADELMKMVSSIDLSTPDKIKAYKDWQEKDGTKEGLLKLKGR
jgi:hypothetical protein